MKKADNKYLIYAGAVSQAIKRLMKAIPNISKNTLTYIVKSGFMVFLNTLGICSFSLYSC